MSVSANPELHAKECSPSGCIGIPDSLSSFSPWLFYGLTAVCLGVSCYLLYRWLKDPSRMGALVAAMGILLVYAFGMGRYLAKLLKALESGAKSKFVIADLGECDIACETARQIRDVMEFGVYAVVMVGTAVAVHMFHRWKINPKDQRLLFGAIAVAVFSAGLAMVYEIYT